MTVLRATDVADYLNVGNDQINKVTGVLAAAEAAIASMVGPLTVQPATTVRVIGGPELFLPDTPVHELVSVTQSSGAVLDVVDLDLDQPGGIVTRRAFHGPAFGTCDVTYTAGRAQLPPDLVAAIKEAARHLWEAPNGGSTYGDTTPVEDLPHVRALVEPHRPTPAIG